MSDNHNGGNKATYRIDESWPSTGGLHPKWEADAPPAYSTMAEFVIHARRVIGELEEADRARLEELRALTRSLKHTADAIMVRLDMLEQQQSPQEARRHQ